MSEDVVVTLVNHDSEDLVDFPEVHQVKLGGDEEGESASEGDIEIEHYVGDDTQPQGQRGEGDIEIEHYVGNDTQQGGENCSGEDPNQASNITFDVRKRTLIMLWQRTILEEYYRAGMTSASMQLHSLHQEASEKTGLDNSVVKNWIRNRRRPAAIKSAERMVEKISQGELVAPYVPPTSLTSLGTSLHPSPPNPIIAFSQSRSSSGRSGLSGQQGLGPSDPKKMCTDQPGSSPHWPFSTPSSVGFTLTQHSLHPTPSPSLHPTPSPSLHTVTASLLVKIRVNGSGETDFYEVEVPSLTYESLLKACADEIEVETSQVAKIRKLPNILIRRDKDVQRLKEGQELEVVLKEEGGQHGVSAFCTSSGGLSMLNLSPLVTDTPPLGRSGVSQHLNGLQ